MRIIKSFVAAAVFLLALESLTSAEMTGMSLQERRSQSDAVVVGTIEEVHQTDAGVGGQFPPPVTHWLATCRVERYIIGPKIHNPNVEEAKAVRLIRIAFEHRLQKPMLVKLVAGKKYLLFLKETGPNEYEMITPYHGALEAGQDYFFHDEQNPEYPQAVKMSFEEIVQRVTQKNPASVDIREQLDAATSYWYAYFREKMLGEGRTLRNVRTEGDWTIAEVFSHHGFIPLRVLTRFLDAEETKIQGLVMVLGNIKSLLRSSMGREVEEGIREIGILSSKDDICLLPEQCLKWIEGYEDYVFWDEEGNILSIAKEARMANFGRAVRGMALSIKTDKTTYGQNELIVLTARLENILPASGRICAVFSINARMLIHSEIVFDVRNEKGEYVHFLPPEPPPALTTKDFKRFDGGQSIESQEEITTRFHEKPLRPGRYRIRAAYQNYELGKTLWLSPSCAGSSVLLEGGPAWVGRVFSNTVEVEVRE